LKQLFTIKSTFPLIFSFILPSLQKIIKKYTYI
jgi:hypothetical protein